MTGTVGADWTPIARLRMHEQVLAQVEEQILEGKLRPGARLPGERQLAEMLGVGRGAVREALRVLEAMGILEAGVGSGPYAGSTIAGHATPALGNLLRLHMALSVFSQQEVVEVRIQLERWAVTEAAKGERSEEILALRRIIDSMKRSDMQLEEFNEVDTEFHVAIASSCGNSLLAKLMQSLRDVVRREMVAVFQALPDWRATADCLVLEHEEILAAIEQGDGERAARLVTEHISNFYSGIHPSVHQ